MTGFGGLGNILPSNVPRWRLFESLALTIRRMKFFIVCISNARPRPVRPKVNQQRRCHIIPICLSDNFFFVFFFYLLVLLFLVVNVPFLNTVPCTVCDTIFFCIVVYSILLWYKLPKIVVVFWFCVQKFFWDTYVGWNFVRYFVFGLVFFSIQLTSYPASPLVVIRCY